MVDDSEEREAREAMVRWAISKGVPGAEVALERGYGIAGLVVDWLRRRLEAKFGEGEVFVRRSGHGISFKRRADPLMRALEVEGRVIEMLRATGLPLFSDGDDIETGYFVHGVSRCVASDGRWTAVVFELVTVDGNTVFAVRAE